MIDFTFELKEYLPFKSSVCIGDNGLNVFEAFKRSQIKALDYFRRLFIFDKQCDERYVLNNLNLCDIILVHIATYGNDKIDISQIFKQVNKGLENEH